MLFRLPALLCKWLLAIVLLCIGWSLQAQSFHAFTEWASKALQLKQYDEAHHWLQQANIVAPNATELYPLLGKTSYHLKQYPECNQWYSNSKGNDLSLKPEDYGQWIECLIRLGHYDEALIKIRETQHKSTDLNFYKALESWSLFALDDNNNQNNGFKTSRYSRQVNTRGNERAAVEIDGQLHYFRESGLFHIHNNRARAETSIEQAFLHNNRSYELRTITPGSGTMKYFGTFCTPEAAFQQHCLIAVYSDGKWAKLPYAVNPNGFNSIHPHFSDFDGDSILWYASDKPGGLGGYDIWRIPLENGTWTMAENAGSTINSTMDDWSPVVSYSGVLYFSSNGHPGFGGFDIYRFSAGQHKTPENLGNSVNSSFDEIYFNFTSDTTGYFSSDIPQNPARYRGTCCFDIFTWSASEFDSPSPLDSEEPPLAREEPKVFDWVPGMEITTTEMEKLLKQLEPCTLLFHNNEPTASGIASGQMYPDFKTQLLSLKPEYLSNNEPTYHPVVAETFRYVESSVNQLDSLLQALDALAAGGGQFRVNLAGFASPRFRSDYNELLSRRRVKSVLRYIEETYPWLLEHSNIKWFSEALGDQTSPSDDGPYTGVYTMQSLHERRVVVLVEILK